MNIKSVVVRIKGMKGSYHQQNSFRAVNKIQRMLQMMNSTLIHLACEWNIWNVRVETCTNQFWIHCM